MNWLHLTLCAAIGTAGALQVPSPSPSTPAPAVAPSGTPASPPATSPEQPPAAAGSPAATAPASPALAPTLSPAPQPTFAYRFVPHPQASPNPGAPQIIEVDLNSRVLKGTIAIRVLTNDVVTRVENHTNGRADVIPQTGPGEFIAVSKLPKLPFFARGFGVDLEFVAYAADGTKTSVKVPVKIG